jgi:hypothetical protein
VSFLIVIGHTAREGQTVVQLERTHQGTDGSPLTPALAVRLAEVAADRESIGLRQRITCLQVDRAAQAAFRDRGTRVLDDIDPADLLARDAFEGLVLGVAASAATGTFTRDIELFAGEKDVAVQRGQVLAQAIDQHCGALTLGAVNLHAR